MSTFETSLPETSRDHFLSSPYVSRRTVLGGVAAAMATSLVATPSWSQDAPVPSRDELLKIGDGDIPLGDPSAPVVMFGYESFTCPHCAAFHSSVMPSLKTDYIDTGKLRYVMRDFPLDGLALRASMLARCIAADKGNKRYNPFVELLFSAQQQWARSSDPIAALSGLGKQAGLSQERIDACLQDRPLAESVVKHRRDGTAVFEVRSTPTFVFGNGQTLVGARPVEEFATVIDELYDDAT